MTVHLNTCEIYGLWTESNLDDGLLDRGLASAVVLDGARPEGRHAEFRYAELDLPGSGDELYGVVAASVGLPTRRPLVALGPDELGRPLVNQRVERLLDGIITRFFVSLRSGSSSTDTMFADTARAPSSMICCLATGNHMTWRAPCSAMRLSICERNYASPQREASLNHPVSSVITSKIYRYKS